MTNLTDFIREKHFPYAVYLTPGAERYLVSTLEEQQVPLSAARPAIAHAVHDFLTSPYWTKSAWFKAQPVHSFAALEFRDPDTKAVRLVVFLHLQLDKAAALVLAPDDSPLPEQYYVDRVMEETRVLYG